MRSNDVNYALKSSKNNELTFKNTCYHSPSALLPVSTLLKHHYLTPTLPLCKLSRSGNGRHSFLWAGVAGYAPSFSGCNGRRRCSILRAWRHQLARYWETVGTVSRTTSPARHFKKIQKNEKIEKGEFLCK